MRKTDAQKASDVIERAGLAETDRLRRQVEAERRRSSALISALSDATQLLDSNFVPIAPKKVKPARAAKHLTRVIIPDTHGAHIDTAARDSFLHDLELLKPEEIVWLGDHLDCAGTFSGFAKQSTHELAENYSTDIAAANDFLDRAQALAPNARHYYLQGNHEFRIDRWAVRSFTNLPDALLAIAALGYVSVLHLDRRGFQHYNQDEFYDGLTIPGTLKLGKVRFTHGFSCARQAATVTLERVSDNVVFGHTHRVQSVIERTAARTAFGAWSIGCLSKLQPLYRHTTPTSWSHAYGAQFVNASTGTFAHFTVPLIEGDSLLLNVINGLDRHGSC